MDPMLVSAFSRGYGSPKHWAEHWIDGGEVAVNTSRHKPGDVGHLTRFQQRLDDLPVGRVPSDEQNALQVNDSKVTNGNNYKERR